MGRLKGFWVAAAFLVIFSQIAFCGTYGGGSGIEGDPYLISTAEQMQEIGANEADWDKHFLLTADIDLEAYTGASYNIIGNMTDKFIGVFDGGGNNVSNFTYSSSSQDYVGLFGVVGSGGLVRDLGVVGVNINTGQGNYAGGLAGASYGDISSCFVSGSVAGGNRIGGFVGGNGNGAEISNCYCACSVGGYNEVGGFVGASDGAITKCYSIGTINGNLSIGGFAGYNYSGSYMGSFWNNETNPDLTGVGNIDDPSGIFGRNTAAMKTQTTYTASRWDFAGESANGTKDIWYMPGCGYPALWWQEFAIVPDVTGLSESEAVNLLEGAGFIVELILVENEDVEIGYVISQEPEAGNECSVVTITVSLGNDIIVAKDGSGDYLTIQEGIDAAVDGKAVVIKKGIYRGAGNINLDFKGKAITVRGTNPDDADVVIGTVIDCEQDGRGFIFNSNEGADSVVAGLTITKGRLNVTRDNPESYGAGILCEGASPTIEYCRIINCSFLKIGGSTQGDWYSAKTYGGGIACKNNSNPVISRCMISNCTTYTGGGGGIACLSGSYPVISDCSISNCTSSSIGGGGIVVESNSSAVVRNSSISGCVANSPNIHTGGGGGGVNCGFGCRIDISNSVISWNKVEGGMVRVMTGVYEGLDSYGGGLWFHSGASSDITNCLIIQNEAVLRDGIGGGDHGKSQGGGIYCKNTANITIRNCTVADNITYITPAEADGYIGEGGGIYGSAVVVDSIVWGNVSGSQLADGTSVSFSNVEGGWAGSIDSDPMFVLGDGGGNYYLSQTASGQGETSPCVDSGSMTAIEAGMDELTTRSDKAGDGGVVDMGYHYPGRAYWAADLNHDWKIDIVDFAIMASQWQDVPGEPSADIAPQDGDNFVGIEDLSAFCAEWMRQ